MIIKKNRLDNPHSVIMKRLYFFFEIKRKKNHPRLIDNGEIKNQIVLIL